MTIEARRINSTGTAPHEAMAKRDHSVEAEVATKLRALEEFRASQSPLVTRLDLAEFAKLAELKTSLKFWGASAAGAALMASPLPPALRLVGAMSLVGTGLPTIVTAAAALQAAALLPVFKLAGSPWLRSSQREAFVSKLSNLKADVALAALDLPEEKGRHLISHALRSHF